MRQAVYHSLDNKGIFDTHAHLYDERFLSEGMEVKDILFRASQSGITRILVPSDSVETSRKAIDLVCSYDGQHGVSLYCSVGVHPHEAKDWADDTEDILRAWLSERDRLKIRALGEIGLDYHYDFSPRDVQKEVFEKQLQIAYDCDIPIILHEREAAGDSTAILQSFFRAGKMRSNPGVCHCSSASPETARILMDMGFYIGFDGPLTFKNNKNTVRLAEYVPLDRIVIETDSPYLTPEPNRGAVNEPAHVAYVADKIAQIKGIDPSEAVRITTENGLRLYEIGEET